MKNLKFLIDNMAYIRIVNGLGGIALASNDFVSTTRRDPNGSVHQYESRHHLAKAFLKANESKLALVWSNNNPTPIKVIIKDIGNVHGSGLWFALRISPFETKKAVAK